MNNIRKALPALAFGVCITLLAALFNYMIYDRRLPAMAAGNRILSERNDGKEGGLKHPGSIPGLLAALVNLADDFATDAMYAVRGHAEFPSTRDQIAVIAIDAASLDRHGSWPWPRSDIATLVEKASNARVVGVDLLFREPDRTSLSAYVDQFSELYGAPLDTKTVNRESLDNDLLLGEIIAQTNTVLGASLSEQARPAQKPAGMKNAIPPITYLPDSSIASNEDVLLRQTRWVLTDIPAIRDVMPQPVGEGFMNLFPGPSGTVRGIPLLAHVSDDAFSFPTGSSRRIVPSFALEMMRVALDGDRYCVNLRGDKVIVPEFRDATSTGERYAVKSITITRAGEDVLTIPVNELGVMDVSYRNHRNDFRVYPAWEVLAGIHDGVFKDKLVIIGGTVASVDYVPATGLPDPEVTVVEAHAAILSAMLKRDFIDSGYADEYWWQQAAILGAGALVTVAIVFGDVLGGMIVSALTLVGLALLNYFLFFKRGIGVGVTLPILSTLAVLSALMLTNYMVVGRERRFIRKAFQSNVSPSILGYLETHPDRLSSLQGEHRHMTVLFTDIRAFTSMSELMTAPDLARFLNEYFTPMSDIVMRHMGTVDKFIGDGMMAFWNAPADNPHHARDAARSALDMLTKLSELQHGWTTRGLPQVSIGCGINTGPMFAGYMGSEQRKNYTVMGDSVNIASRLENLNKAYLSSILITESTKEELGNEFVSRVVDKVRVSGKAEALLIYELLGLAPASEEKYEELASFGRVFELYQEREFATAETLLKELVFIRPSPLYKMYLDRLAIYKALPPPPDWDGTFSMTHK